MYSFSNQVVWLRSFMTYVDDAGFIDEMMIKLYDDVVPRIERALGDSPVAQHSK